MTQTLTLPNSREDSENVLTLPFTPPPVPSDREISRDAAFYSVATSQNYEAIRSMIENNWTGAVQADAATGATAALERTAAQTIDLDSEEAGEVLTGVIQELRDIDAVARFLPPSFEAAVRANVSGSRSMAIDRIAKLQYAGESISGAMEDFGWNAATALDFAEVVVDPLAITRVPIYRRLTSQFEDLLSPNVSVEEFEQGMDSIIQEAMDAGWLSEENRVHFATFLDFLGSGVFSPEARAEVALGWMDVGLSVIGAGQILSSIRRAADGTLRGTTAITTGTVSRGPSGAVVDAARNDIHGLSMLQPGARRNEVIESRVTEAVLLDEVEAAGTTSASILTPSTLRHSFYSAAEHAAIRTLEETSRAFDVFRGAARDVGTAFDDAAFETFRTRYRTQRLERLHQQGFTRLIDVDVGVDDFNNIFSIDVIGKADGTPYSATPRGAMAARAVMEDGDDLLQNADGTYVILRRTNINIDSRQTLEDLELFRATDPNQLGDGIWARIGSPLAQADPETSSYLFRAESIMNRTMSSLNRETLRTLRGMRARDIAQVYDVFEYLARSDRRNAFTREQFAGWFRSVFKTEPTEAQVNLYVLEQSRLDAQLFINADTIYKRAVAQNAVVARFNDQDFVVTRARDVPDGRVIYDPAEGKLVTRDSLPEGTIIYENLGSTDFPMNALYIRGSTLDTRAVRHSDFFIRNAGGHRGYVVNAMQFLVKQENTRAYAGGITRAEAPTTLLGARTAEEAQKAASEVNTIIRTINEVIPVNGRSAREYLDALETAATSRRIDDIIAGNRSWNPEIEGLVDLVRFANERGLDLRTQFRVVAEGEPLEAMYDGKNIFQPNNATHGDVARMSLSTRGRGQGPLPMYGGGTVPQRSTEDMLRGSFARTVASVSEQSYAMRAFNGLMKAAKEHGVLKVEAAALEKLPIRTQIERILRDGLIDKTGATGAANVGRRLELDMRRLQFRLQNVSHATRIWRNITRNIANFLYGKNFKWGANLFDRWSTDPISALRGFAFDAYLGFFNPSQLLMQSMQVVNIVGIAGLKGIQGAAMYPVMRFALANGNPAVIRRTGQLLENVTGLKADQFVDMVTEFQRSGRHIVDMNLAEMTATEDAASSVAVTARREFARTMGNAFRRTREAGRFFFKEGDLVARITAFNTAYIRAVEKYGPRTAKNTNEFTRFITWEEQRLTQGMTAASRQAYEQLPFMQFMTYQLRINEALFAGTFTSSKAVLTKGERIRLAATHAIMFGAMASTGTAYLSQWFLSQNEVDLPENVVRAFQRGMLDAALSTLTDSETAASTRFASSMGLWNIAQGMSNEGILWFAGPGLQLGSNVTETTYGVLMQALHAIGTGDTAGFEAELVDFARLTSTGNYIHNAITAIKYDEYRTRRNQVVTDDLTSTSDAVFSAFGIPLEEVAATYEFLGQERARREWLRSHANRITEMHILARQAAQRDDVEAFAQFYRSISDAYNMLEPFERDEVERMVGDEGTLDDNLMLRMLLRQSEYFEQTTREMN